MKKYLIFGIMACVILILIGIIRIKTRENKRLSANQAALLEDVRYYRTTDSLSAASVQVLTLTNTEFKQHNDVLVSDAESLNLKVKRLESAAVTATATVVELVTVWRDSIVYINGGIDTIRCVDYEDAYITVNACEIDSLIHGTLSVRDTLVQFVHRVPRQWLFFKWGTKAVRQEVLTKNPYNTITYTEFIKLQKR